MSSVINPVRGMNDILPDSTPCWQQLEGVVRTVLQAYGYREIRVPIIERTELFKRSIGESTDIVEKEMYTFEDRGGDSLTLRPEATAGLVRAGISHGLLHNQRQRLWCHGPMFRYERPQKGRYRQFHQVDVEALGYEGPDVDAELILVGERLWRSLGLEGLRLEINSLGTRESRRVYRDELVSYFSAHADQLDPDSERRLRDNPLRILDSKHADMQELIAGAPAITEHLDSDSRRHFDGLCELLTDAGIEYRLNSRLVRGLDYYTRTVFEWLTERLGAQDAVCSGGRYDDLVGQLGGSPTPAIGWAMGVERLVELMRAAQAEPAGSGAHAYLVAVGDEARRAGIVLAEELRNAAPGLRLEVHCGGGGFRSQMKKADRSGAFWAVILGEDEVAGRRAGLKPLRTDAEQEQHSWAGLGERMVAWLANAEV